MEITTNAGVVADRFQRAAGVYDASIERALRGLEGEAERRLREVILATFTGSGEMARRVRARVSVHPSAGDGSPTTVQLRVRSGVKYAAIQEHGGTIVGRRGLLAIPLSAALVRNVRSARQFGEQPERFGFSGTFTRDGIMFGRSLDHHGAVPMFALRSQVTLHGRPAHATAGQQLAPRAADDITRAVDRATREAFHESAGAT